MKIVFSEDHQHLKSKILDVVKEFEIKGKAINDGKRNSIKIFDIDGKQINIKSFKVPNAINKIAYKYFRKSKAERSFNYAQKLLKKNIGTPAPIAYIEESSGVGFGKSYYISQQLPADLTYRELVQEPDFPENDAILRAFTRFTFKMHENNIEFLDHSPGNTLIQIKENNYEFYLVDLNRMNFRVLDFDARMKNFSRLTPKKEMVEIMANEYAPLINKPEPKVFQKMWFYTEQFQEKFHRKQRLKKKLKFWKSEKLG